MSSSDEAPSSSAESAFRIWVNQARGRTLKASGAVLKPGPEVMKVVELCHYGDAKDGEVKNRTLKFRSFNVGKHQAPDFEDDKADKNNWYCENEEIEKLLAFLHHAVARTGRYQVVDIDSPDAALLELLETNDVDAQALVDALIQNCDVEQLVSLLAGSDLGLSAAQSAVVGRRRELVSRLFERVNNPASTETQILALIGDAYWIFGGRYVGVAERRNLTMLDQHDIPLLRSDGTLHIVELKGPRIKKLIVRHRNHWIVGPDVHEAASQAMSYLRSLDDSGLGLSKMYESELGQRYDMSRVFATVIIGHSDHHRPEGVARDVVTRTLRQYNAHLSRVEVITYDQLAESAERALAFEKDSKDGRPLGVVAAQDDPWGSPTPVSPWDDEPPF